MSENIGDKLKKLQAHKSIRETASEQETRKTMTFSLTENEFLEINEYVRTNVFNRSQFIRECVLKEIRSR